IALGEIKVLLKCGHFSGNGLMLNGFICYVLCSRFDFGGNGDIKERLVPFGTVLHTEKVFISTNVKLYFSIAQKK
uniref:Uncharacterized protein n=1 Tax=Salmo trutta TaxID=8032 RepID=A0A673WPT2_SALTR